MAVPKPEERYSWQEYLNWPTDERFELIEGVAYAMSPAPRRRHQEISGELFYQAYTALREGGCKVFAAPFDVKLSSDEDNDAPTVVQPDLTVCCDPEKLTEQGMTGPPDLVVEIVSPESGIADRRRKFAVYESYGVKEYWIVDQDEELVEVYVLKEGRLNRAAVYAKDEELAGTAVPELRVSLKDVFVSAQRTSSD
ncbi:MAG: Uma2 family endonuclease [Spirochaetaceae bacterium]